MSKNDFVDGGSCTTSEVSESDGDLGSLTSQSQFSLPDTFSSEMESTDTELLAGTKTKKKTKKKSQLKNDQRVNSIHPVEKTRKQGLDLLGLLVRVSLVLGIIMLIFFVGSLSLGLCLVYMRPEKAKSERIDFSHFDLHQNSDEFTYSSPFEVSGIEDGQATCSVFSQIDAHALANDVVSDLVEELSSTSSTNRRDGFGADEYECHGACYCEDDDGRRNAAAAAVARGMRLSVYAVSAGAAIFIAKNKFDSKCESKLGEECPFSSSVDDCSLVSAEERFMFPDNTVELPTDLQRQELVEALGTPFAQILLEMEKICFDSYPTTLPIDLELDQMLDIWFMEALNVLAIDWSEIGKYLGKFEKLAYGSAGVVLIWKFLRLRVKMITKKKEDKEKYMTFKVSGILCTHNWLDGENYWEARPCTQLLSIENEEGMKALTDLCREPSREDIKAFPIKALTSHELIKDPQRMLTLTPSEKLKNDIIGVMCDHGIVDNFDTRWSQFELHGVKCESGTGKRVNPGELVCSPQHYPRDVDVLL